MPRMNVTLSPQMHAELQKLADERDWPMALIIRRAVSDYLNSQGRPVDDVVQWGGKRDTPKKD